MASRIRFAVPIALALLFGGGCGTADEKTPVACLAGPGAYLRALRGAPTRAELAGATPISTCLTRNQSAGELTQVGGALVSAATSLNAQARGGAQVAALRLGYLIGAARRGAEDTDGIHANLEQRLDAAARFSPGGGRLAAPIVSAYRAGIAAGSAHG